MKNCKGFTLIELLVVIGVVTILATISIPIYGNLSSATDLGETSVQVTQLFRKARTLSFNAYRNTSYGVYYDDSEKKFILYSGDSFAVRDQSADYFIPINSLISVISSDQDPDIHFAKGTGLTSRNGYLELSHRATNNFKRINFNYLGVVDLD